MYKAELMCEEPISDDRWLEVMVGGEWHEVYMGDVDDPDADDWLAIAHLWIAAGELLEGCEMARAELMQLAEAHASESRYKAGLLDKVEALDIIIAKAKGA